MGGGSSVSVTSVVGKVVGRGSWEGEGLELVTGGNFTTSPLDDGRIKEAVMTS